MPSFDQYETPHDIIKLFWSFLQSIAHLIYDLAVIPESSALSVLILSKFTPYFPRRRNKLCVKWPFSIIEVSYVNIQSLLYSLYYTSDHPMVWHISWHFHIGSVSLILFFFRFLHLDYFVIIVSFFYFFFGLICCHVFIWLTIVPEFLRFSNTKYKPSGECLLLFELSFFTVCREPSIYHMNVRKVSFTS